jgi:hypothetical protein
MIKARIIIDLPSQELMRRKGVLEWIRSLFGIEIDLRTGKEELTLGGYLLMQGLLAALERANVTDVISLIVDRSVIYMDTEEVAHDLPQLDAAVQQSGMCDRPFREMHLVLSHREHGLHTIIDVRVTSQVVVGQSEMLVTLSSRPERLRVRKGESARAYGDRVQAFIADEAGIAQARQSADALARRLGDALEHALTGAKVWREPSWIQIIRPSVEQIGRFRQLGFDDHVEEPHYRPVPTHHRSGAYADPFYYYYYDPYFDLVQFWIVSAMVDDALWRSPDVHVVDRGGQELFTGHAVHADALWAGAGAVGLDDAGALHVHESIPDAPVGPANVSSDGQNPWPTSDVGTHGSDSVSGTDTSGHSSGGGFFSSLFGGDMSSSSCSSGSSCNSGSSCGSSCSGSSCGSSCGGT